LKRDGVPFWPDAAWRDVVFGAALIFALFLLAWLVGAPHLAKPPDPTILDAQPRPDWYLLWYFALLALLPHALENYVIIVGPLLFGLLLLLPPLFFNTGERSAWRRPWAIGLVIAFWMMIGTLWIEGKRSPWSPDFSATPLPASIIGASTGPVYEGARLFRSSGCEYCHQIAGYGGLRGPDLTYVRDRLSEDQLTIRIVNGATNMSAFGGILSAEELTKIVAFLNSRKLPSGTLDGAK
jgi:ubiquinol-cytochrome c reductase cytochrome b subunit